MIIAHRLGVLSAVDKIWCFGTARSKRSERVTKSSLG